MQLLTLLKDAGADKDVFTMKEVGGVDMGEKGSYLWLYVAPEFNSGLIGSVVVRFAEQGGECNMISVLQ